MQNPLVTIVIPVFNREKFIDETIQSVMNQSYTNWELIIVDDGSTDRSMEIAQSYCAKDNRIKFFQRKSQLKGASVCRNIGIKNSTGDWIIFLDSDDLLAEWCIEKRIQRLEQNKFEFDFLVFPMLYFKHKRNDMMVLQNIKTNLHPLDRFLLRENVWLMSSVIWRKSFLTDLGGYREEAKSFQDWEINVRALIKSDKWDFYDKDIPDNFYRQHESTISLNRFTFDHTCNNLDTFVDCFIYLNNSEKYSEKRRLFFGAIILEWLNRLGGISMEKKRRLEVWLVYCAKCYDLGIFNELEKKNVFLYLVKNNSLLSVQIKAYRSFLRRKYTRLLPEEFFFKIEKKQGKVIFNGKLELE